MTNKDNDLTNVLCRKCGIHKVPQLYVNKNTYTCRPCRAKQARGYLKNSTPEQRNRRKEQNKKWKERNKEKIAAYRDKKKNEKREYENNYRKVNETRYKANNLLSNSIRLRTIIRPSVCSRCGIICKPDGHHEDYNKPLDVVWLCKPCHMKRHSKYGDLDE